MLKFIKSLFSREEKVQGKISFSDLDNWLDEKSKITFDDLKDEIKTIINEITDEKNNTIEKIKKLENASLQNPNIPNRAKTIMEGNREAFIKRSFQFLDGIELKYDNFDELAKKCDNLEENVTSLAKSTARSYMILNEFFARELRAVSENIKKIEDLSKKIKNSIEKKKIKQITGLKGRILDINYKIGLKNSLLKELEDKKAIISEKSSNLNNLKNRIDELKESHDYEDFEKLSKEKENFEKELRNLDSRIFHDFSIIEKALKKYAKIAFNMEELIYSYIENPIKALEKDDNLEIIEVLNKLKVLIEKNKLGIEEKKNEKITTKIKELSTDYLISIKISSKKIIVQLEKIEHELRNNKTKNEFDSCNKDLEKLKDEVNKRNENADNLNNEIIKIKIEDLKEELKQNIKNTLDEEIIIS